MARGITKEKTAGLGESRGLGIPYVGAIPVLTPGIG